MIVQNSEDVNGIFVPHKKSNQKLTNAKIDLSKNENPFPVSDSVKSAIFKHLNQINRYPQNSEINLKENLANIHGVKSENILIANGSSEIIDLLFRLNLDRGKEVVIPEHTFVLYEKFVLAISAKLISIENDHGHQDLIKIASAVNSKTGVVVLVNPSNPMGYIVEFRQLEQFIQKIPKETAIVIDEAYSHYVDNKSYQSAIQLINDYPNCIVSKTFSKAYGLGGLRIGYCIAHNKVISDLEKFARPFMVNCLSLIAANSALNDQKTLAHYNRGNLEGIKQLTQGFQKLGFTYYGTAANFITVNLQCEARVITDQLEKYGVLVKDLAEYGLPDHIRVSIGLPEQNEKLLHLLAKIMRKDVA